MNICMIVHNNVTRDGRVMREANSLQRAGHSVTVLGLLDADASSPVEYLDSGVRVFRIFWQASAYRSLIWSALFRVLPVLAVIAAVLAGVVLGLRAPACCRRVGRSRASAPVRSAWFRTSPA